jgi:hypothetical protein
LINCSSTITHDVNRLTGPEARRQRRTR